MARDHGIRAA